MKKKDKVLIVIAGLAAAIIIPAFIYGAYWMAKTVSYNLFYEDMVRQTVAEMVQPEALKR